MTEPSWYYLHTNGELISKKLLPDPSDFVRKIWEIDPSDRGKGYIMLIEAATLGANMNRVLELAKKWNMDGEDGLEFCKRAGFACIPHEGEAGKGWQVRHENDTPDCTQIGEGSSPLLALISYAKQGPLAP